MQESNRLADPNSLPDLVRSNLKVLFCGINPGACAAKQGHHFLGRGNRFWRVLHQAGFTPHLIDAVDDYTVLRYGCGITCAVDRPTARADQLATAEYLLAKDALVEKVSRLRPAHLAFLGKPAFEAMFDHRHADWGRQAEVIGNTSIWILPNPSGLNRGFSLSELVSAYAALRSATTDTNCPAPSPAAILSRPTTQETPN